MYNLAFLIRKDIFLVRKFMLLLIPYYAYMAFINFNSISMFVAFPILLLLINSCSLDNVHVNQRLVISLPVRRQQIVLAKYLAVIPYAMFGIVCTLLLYVGTIVLGYEPSPSFWSEIGLTLLGIPLFVAVYLPVYYGFGPKGMGVVNMVFILIAMFMSINIVSLVKHSKLLMQ